MKQPYRIAEGGQVDRSQTVDFTFNDQDVSFEDRFDQIRQAPLLILDDFGTQSATDWAKEKLFQISR